MAKLMTVRIYDELLLAQFDDDCRRCGVSRSERIREFMRMCVDTDTTSGTPKPEIPVSPVAGVAASGERDEASRCPHPKAELVKRQYGTWCGLCQTRVR